MAAAPDAARPPRRMVLTGASRGIGHATVKRFMREGWEVVTVSREAPPPECGRDPRWSLHVTADLSVPADRDRLAELRRGLRDRVRASPLGDAAGLARAIEAAYRTLWGQWCEGQRL